MARGRKPKEGDSENGRIQIKLTSKYWLLSDELNYIVATPQVKEDPQSAVIWKSLSFHPTVRGALRWVVEREVKLSKAESLKDLQASYDKMNKWLEKISKQLGEVDFD